MEEKKDLSKRQEENQPSGVNTAKGRMRFRKKDK